MITSDNSFFKSNKKIASFFDNKFRQYGKDDFRSITWSSKENQLLRFKALAEIANLNKVKVLDVGSGLGDFYSYLKDKQIIYTGIEISPELVQASRHKYPGIRVIEADFMDYQFNEEFDYIFASGPFSIDMDNYWDYLGQNIRKMFSLAKKGVGFNLLTSLSINNILAIPFEDGTRIHHSLPNEVVALCEKISPRVQLRIDYMETDFTIYMYK